MGSSQKYVLLEIYRLVLQNKQKMVTRVKQFTWALAAIFNVKQI